MSEDRVRTTRGPREDGHTSAIQVHACARCESLQAERDELIAQTYRLGDEAAALRVEVERLVEGIKDIGLGSVDSVWDKCRKLVGDR